MFLIDRENVFGKLESTPYTPETFAAGANADFNVEPDSLTYSQEIKEFQRKVLDGTLDSYDSVMGKQSGTVSFMIPLNPGAAAATIPNWGKFLQACGYKNIGWDAGSEVAAASAVEGLSWVPHIDCTHIPMTIETVEINDSADPVQLVTRMGGCVGEVSFLFGEIGEPVQMQFEFKGKLISIADRAFASLVTQSGLSTVAPPAILGITVNVGGVVQELDKFEIKTGNSVQLYTYSPDDTGYKGAYIGSRETLLTIDPVSKLLATDPVYTRWKAGTTGALSVVIGTTPPITLSAPKAQYSTAGQGERDEARIIDKVFRLHGSSGNDCFEILQGAKS